MEWREIGMNKVLALQNVGLHTGALAQRQADALKKTNDVTEEYGLTLSDDDVRDCNDRRNGRLIGRGHPL